MGWINAEKQKPNVIKESGGTYPCGLEDSVICAIWRSIEGKAVLVGWAKQRFCDDGNWRNGKNIGFAPTHWMPLHQAPDFSED